MLSFDASPTGPQRVTAQAMQALVPVLRTKRLTLRAPCLDDYAALKRIMEEPTARFMFDAMPSAIEGWLDFAQLTSGWLLRGHGPWAIEQDGEIRGFVSVHFEYGDKEPELGFMLLPEAQGKGFAFEAAKAARAYAFEALKMPTLVSYIDKENTRSIALAERLGGTRDSAAEAENGPSSYVYRYMNERVAA